ncbi:hypothetical protein CN140_11030 [Sinorhizobium meliloti]|uniref:hypothetical protein n=1 Tax=Rhizobium meliloti TaxID=382 RepID=UPI000FDB1105|nr:hypothetical protein [Sinorhizobium meliloti]RVL84862.1 hypothetical protein CN140_11030 [Sinorhizobium meliloti]
MVSGLELFERYIEQKNTAVEAFVADAEKIKKAIEKDRVKGRSPVKLENDTFYKFILAQQPMKIDGRERALDVLSKWISAAYDDKDSDFRAFIEKAYGDVSAPEPVKRRGRKPKDQATA